MYIEKKTISSRKFCFYIQGPYSPKLLLSLGCKFHSEFHGNQYRDKKMIIYRSALSIQKWLHDLQGPVQNKNAKTFVQKHLEIKTATVKTLNQEQILSKHGTLHYCTGQMPMKPPSLGLIIFFTETKHFLTLMDKKKNFSQRFSYRDINYYSH